MIVLPTIKPITLDFISEEALRREHNQAMRERQELLEQMEEHKRLEAEKVERIRRENKMCQEDLSEQIKYQRKQKDREIQEARREIEYLQVNDCLPHYKSKGVVRQRTKDLEIESLS